MSTVIRTIAAAVAAIIVLFLPLFVSNYNILVIDTGIMMGMVVIGLIILVSLTGQLSLGQIAFYALGAYLMGYSNTAWGFHPILAILFAVAVTTLFGLLIGLPSFNLSGPFLSIVTIGFFKIVEIVLTDWHDVTGGPLGMSGIDSVEVASLNFGKPVPFYYLLIPITIAVCIFVYRLRRSTIGRAMISIMDDEMASSMLGINPKQVKLISFGTAAAISGLGGALYASFVTYLVPNAFSFAKSTQALAMAVICGMNVILAPFLSVALNMIPELLRFVQNYYMFIFSIILLIFIMFFAHREYKSHNDT